ncbi:MAG TPA: hypothetical protein PK245_06070, partial [Clostridia bacterium]|nr:hypothetical protein [Clostridia bacterium]
MKSFKQNAKLNKLTGKLMKAALLAFVFAMSFFVCLASLTSGGTNPVSNMVNEIIDSIDDGAPENGSVQVAEAGCGPQQTSSMPNLNTTYTIYAQNETSGGTGNETTTSGNVTLSQNHIYAIKNGVIQITLSYRISNPSSNNQQWGVSFDNASSWGLNMSNKSEGTYTSSATTIPTSFAYSHLRFRTIVSASFLNPAETNDMTARLTTTDSTNPY